jgi:YwqJ-like deaminase
VIDQWEAQLIAAPWVFQGKPVGAPRTSGMLEFDLGYVFWRVSPLGQPEDVGAARAVVDKVNGELTYWPSVEAEAVAERYRAFRSQTPPAPLTWDPVVRARHDRIRAPYPENVTHLRLADGRLRIGHSMKGDGEPNLHPFVAAFLADLPAAYRERGNDRCSEVAVLSDILHAERTVSVEEARTGVLRDAELVTYRIREPGDPTGGEPTAPCVSCVALLRHFGFALQPPAPPEGQP